MLFDGQYSLQTPPRDGGDRSAPGMPQQALSMPGLPIIESWSLLLLLQICTERVRSATDPPIRAMFHLFRYILYRVMMKMMLLLLLLLPRPCLLSNCKFLGDDLYWIAAPHSLD